MAKAQGGDLSCFDADASGTLRAPLIVPVRAAAAGYIASIDAMAIGTASAILGAGRLRKEDAIDHSCGLILKKKTGSWTEAGEALAELHTTTAEKAEEALPMVYGAFTLSYQKPAQPTLIYGRVTASGFEPVNHHHQILTMLTINFGFLSKSVQSYILFFI